MTVTVAVLPAGMDPDDYIRKYGDEKFRTDVIGSGLTWMAYKLQYYRRGKNLQNEGDKLKYIEEVLAEINQLSNPIERDLYIRQLAEEFTLSLDALKQQQMNLNKSRKKKPQTNPQQRPVIHAEPRPKQNLAPAHMTAESARRAGRWSGFRRPRPGWPRLLQSHNPGPSAPVSTPSRARAARDVPRSPSSRASSRGCRRP